MPVHCIVEAADRPAAEQLLLTIGRAGVLSSRAIAAGELDTLLRLLGPPSERHRTALKRATDIVLDLINEACIAVNEAARESGRLRNSLVQAHDGSVEIGEAPRPGPPL